MNKTFDRFPLIVEKPLLSWPLIALKLCLVLAIAVLVEKHCGSLSGRVAVEQAGFNLHTHSVGDHVAYAVAIGPRGPSSDERGVWINKDGTFEINNLPVGEYRLKVHAPGFATTYESGFFVDHAQTTAIGHSIYLQIDHPQVTMGSNTRTFTTREQPHFWISVNGCDRAKVDVYSIDMQKLAMQARQADPEKSVQIGPNLNVYKHWRASPDGARGWLGKNLKVVKSWTRSIHAEDWCRQDYKFEQPLPPGDYVAIAEVTNPRGERDWNLAWFCVTDLGLIVKQDAFRTVVRAIDLNTLRPVTGASIDVTDEPTNRKLAHGITGSDGFASIDAKITDGQQVLIVGRSASCHAYGGLNYYSSGNTDTYRTLFYTDRPVYRLGQTVSFKGICRELDHGRLVNPGAHVRIHATILDPDNNQLKSYSLMTNDHGTFNDIFTIPDDSKTGFYQVVLHYPNGADDYASFEVAEYRKPEYQVQVKPVTNHLVAGQKGLMHLKATYFFGAPVANARVKYTVFSGMDWRTRWALMDRPEYYAYFDGWDEDDAGEGGDDGGYAGQYLCEGYTATDANGEANIEFDTKRQPYDRNVPWAYDHMDKIYRVEAEVTDLSRLTVLGNGSVSVSSGDFALFVTPDSYVQKVGQPITATVRAVAYETHKAASSLPIHVRLYRRLYDRAQYKYRGLESYEDVDAVTDATGQAHITFKTLPQFATDNYEIEATATDSHNDLVADQTSVWIVSEAAPFFLSGDDARKEPLTVKLDKSVYKAGETARIMITAPVTGSEGSQAIVAVEGAKLYSYRIVDMRASAEMVELPLLDEYAPNVYVAVTFIGKKHQFYQAQHLLKVSPAAHFLNVSIETDKPKYKPGETARYTIKTSYADGRPAANTELSLGVVDESIYAIRPDATPDIRKFFYSRRYNSVVTVCSFPEEYSGGPDKGEAPRVRKDFKDTAVWMPVLVTDENGIAQTSVKLPDNLTTWRATVRAITPACDIGEVRQKIITTQDLIVRLSLPRFFSQGDHGVITAVVHNYTPTEQVVRLKLGSCPNFSISTSLEQTLKIKPDSAARYSWPAVARTIGEATLNCTAQGSTAGDAIEVKVPVRPLGVQTAICHSGTLKGPDDSVIIDAHLPGDAVPGSQSLHLYLSSSSIGPVLGNFSSLIDYPYGCTEQTMSKLMPSIIAVRLSQSLGVPLSKSDTDKFKQVYKQSMDKLAGYQHGDGGWGWWADDSSNIYLTALVLDGYKMLQDAGYSVPADRRAHGVKWLEQACGALVGQLQDSMLADAYARQENTIDLSRAAYALSRYHRSLPLTCRKYAIKRIDKLTPEALAYFAMACANTGDSERARAFYSRLVELANMNSGPDGTTLDWAPSKEMFAKLKRKWVHGFYSYRYTGVETTALALEAVCKIEPENVERIEMIKRWILVQRGKDGWENTKTTSEVLRALTEAERLARRQTGTEDFEATIEGPTTASVHFGSKDFVAPEKDIKLSASTEASNYTLRKTGNGRLYYTTVLTYYKRIRPGQYVAANSTLQGLRIKREFFRLVPAAPGSDHHVRCTAEPLRGAVKAGETLLMKVKVDVPDPVPYVLVEVPLPSGGEVVQDDSRTNAREAGDGAETTTDDYWPVGSWWWTHQDVMDDHIAFFVGDLPSTEVSFQQLVRLELPGKFEINPVSLEGMYTKAVRAYSQADEIQVVDQ